MTTHKAIRLRHAIVSLLGFYQIMKWFCQISVNFFPSGFYHGPYPQPSFSHYQAAVRRQ